MNGIKRIIMQRLRVNGAGTRRVTGLVLTRGAHVNQHSPLAEGQQRIINTQTRGAFAKEVEQTHGGNDSTCGWRMGGSASRGVVGDNIQGRPSEIPVLSGYPHPN